MYVSTLKLNLLFEYLVSSIFITVITCLLGLCILKPKMVKSSYIFSCGNSHGMSSMKYGLMSFKKMMEEALVPLTLF